MSNFDSIIFDMDGTLWDCSRASVVGFNRAYKELGVSKSVDVDLIHFIAGKPSSEYNHILLDLKSPCYIGDTAGDKLATEEVGIPFFHAKYGFDPILSVNKDHSFTNFFELTDYFTR